MQHKNTLSRLAEIQFLFEGKIAEEKIALIEKQVKANFKSSKEIIAFHDRLLCLLAFADTPKVFDAANRALAQLAEKTKIFLETAGANDVWEITESGIAHASLRASFSYEMIKWLVENFGHEISFSSCYAPKEIITAVFKQILPPAVGEMVFDNHEHTLQGLAKKIAGKSKPMEVLLWTLTQFSASSIPDKSKEQLYEMLGIYIEWKTTPLSPTRSFARAAAGKKHFFHHQPLIHHADLPKIFGNKKLTAVLLTEAEKKNLCAVAKGVLCSTYREIDPITYAEETDTELYDIGRGITIALYFMRPSWRLSCESYVSYMAFRNGVPVSYGGGWLFFDRTKLAGNVFPAFRGGESAYLFAHLYRLYHLRFGANCFQVDPYQIGQKNEDAISSGAFWFYHRLGFRPNDAVLLQLEKEEDAKRKADKKYRSPATVLRKFAHGEMILNLAKHVHISHQVVLQKMNALVEKDFSGNFSAYFQRCFLNLQKACRKNIVILSKDLQNYPLAQELGGIVSVFSDYAKWNKPDLTKLVLAMEEKEKGSERKFIELFNTIKSLRKDIYLET